MKLFIIFLIALFGSFCTLEAQRPKLVIGIVVDQMRAEYLYRFYEQYSDNGFKRLMYEGFNYRNVHINYIPTITGPGHASIYAGTSPRFHGIIGNSWYDRSLKKVVYCVIDSTEHLVGSTGNTIGISPRNLLSTNISDELKISTNLKAKVIAISLKDRAAVLPAGHMADGAYWFDLASGNFISSTFYMKKLPDWVVNFNDKKVAFKYLDSTWNLLKPANTYTRSINDDNNYEYILKGKERPVFPYNLKELASKNNPYFEVLNRSPFGNSLLTDFAIETIKKENLGKGDYTDLLAISFSSTDAVGHTYGPLSKEINDTYLRLDMDIARLLDALDQFVGKGNYTIFLTADHGVNEVPQYLIDHKIPAGYLNFDDLVKDATSFLNQQLGENKWIEATRNEQFYLNRTLIREKKLDLAMVQNLLADFFKDRKGIACVYTATQLDQQEFTQNLSFRVQNGFYYKRSGDVKLIMEPGWTDDLDSSSTHGTGYTYDTHVPLLWFGFEIRKGESCMPYNITDIAPTLAMILHTKFPSACIGNPLLEVLSK